MRRTFLIARQEFIKYVTRRGFLISILMFPLWIAIVVLMPQWVGGAPQRVFTIVDRAGGYREMILKSLAQEDEERDLKALARYAGIYADTNAMRRSVPRLSKILDAPQSAQSASQLRAAGGWQAALGMLAPFLKPGARPFHAPESRFVYVDPPARLERVATQQFGDAVRPYLAGGQFSAAIMIPRDFGTEENRAAHYFARDLSDTDLRDFATDALSDALRRNFLRRLAPALADSDVFEAIASLESHNPTKSDTQTGRDDSLDSLVPMALAIILFIVSVMNASVLLQGVVEEKSTRMIEVLLSCATPREITSGKLFGVILVALVTVAIWALALFGLMAIADANTVTMVFSALRSVATMDTLPLLLLYFFCGLLIYGSVFLAIGSMANSLADAQSLLGPAMLILMLPNLMISAVMRDPNGAFASIISWVPFYTPFFMMLRVASHPPALQLWGTTALAIVTTAFLIWWTGRIFAKHVLTTERPPTLVGLLKRSVQSLSRLRL